MSTAQTGKPAASSGSSIIATSEPSSGGGGGAIAVEQAGSPVVASATTLNFTGEGVTVTAGGAGVADVAISGGGGGGGVVIEQLNAFSDAVPIAIAPNGGQAYVGNEGGRTVAVINATSKTVTSTIPVGLSPSAIAFTPDGTKAYVANGIDGTVSVIDVATGSVIATVTVGVGPFAIAILPSGTAVYVANFNDGVTTSVTVIRTSDNTVIATVPTGANPQFIVASPDSAHVYVTNNGDGTITQIVTAGNTHSAFTIGTAPSGIAVSSDSTTLYVSDSTNNVVRYVNATTHVVTQTVAVGNTPLGPVVLLPNGSKLYVYNSTDNTVSAIVVATHTVSGTIAGTGGFFLAATPDSSKVYAANSAGNQVMEILTAGDTIGATVAVAGSPQQLAITPNGALCFVTLGTGVDIITIAGNTDTSVPGGVSFGTATTLDLSPDFLVTNEGAGVIGLAIDNTQFVSPSFAPVTYLQGTVAANLSGHDMKPAGFLTSNDLVVTFTATRIGSIIGLSSQISQGISAGTATMVVTINGNPGTLSLELSATENSSGGVATQAPGIDFYEAGSLIGVRLTTSAGFATGDTPGDLYAWLELAESTIGVG